MTEKQFMADAYLQEAKGTMVDESVFYPTGGGQIRAEKARLDFTKPELDKTMSVPPRAGLAASG